MKQSIRNRSSFLLPLLLCSLTLVSFLVLVLTDRLPDSGAPTAASSTCAATEHATESAGLQRERVPASHAELAGLYRAAVGTRLRYTFLATSGMSRIQRPEQAERALSAPHEVDRLEGTLEYTVADRRADEILVRVRFADLSAEQTAGGAPVLLTSRSTNGLLLANQVVWVRLRNDGCVLGYVFPGGLAPTLRNRVRSIVGGFAFVVPADAADGWTSTQADGSGTFTARYRLAEHEHCAGATVLRARELYSEPSPEPGGVEQRCLGDEARAHLCSEVGWLRDARVNEGVLAVLRGLEVALVVTWSGELALVRIDRADDLDTGMTQRLWGGDWQSAAGNGEDVSRDRQADQVTIWTARLASITNQGLVAMATQLLNEGTDLSSMVPWLDALAWKMKLDGAAVAEVERAILLAADRPEQASFFMQALCRAGTDAAQVAIAWLYADRSQGTNLSDLAAGALFQLERPSRDLLSVVATEAEDLGTLAHWDSLEERRLLLFGALSTRGAGALLDGRRAVDVLLGLEAHAQAAGSVETWIHALGNSGGAEIEPRALHYLAHESESVREAAVMALRKLDGARSWHALVDTAANDASERVRAAATEVLGMRSGASGQKELAALARNAANSNVRKAALAALLVDPRARESARGALESSMRDDPDPEVRGRAAQLLAETDAGATEGVPN